MKASLFVPAVIIKTDQEDERKGLVEEGLERERGRLCRDLF
jgi:hypothetical protein